MKSWLGMVSMLWAGGGEAGRGPSVPDACLPGPAHPPCCNPTPDPPPRPAPAGPYPLWLRFSTSMFLAFSSSRGHSVNWL